MERWNDSLTGDLDAGTLAALREHLAGCTGCASEARTLQSLWDGLGAAETETPSAALRARFDRMLERELAEHRRLGELAAPAAFTPRREVASRERSLQRAAFGFALAAALVIALGAGVFIGSSTASKRGAQDVAELRTEIQSLRSTVALALLAESSASERLNGIAFGRELQGEDRRVADALFETLLLDPNVNVRLAALDALREQSFRPENRARLLQSIPEQDSPLVQISAIDVLLESTAAAPSAGGEPPRQGAAAQAAPDDLVRLAQDPGLDQVVRGYLLDRLERSPR